MAGSELLESVRELLRQDGKSQGTTASYLSHLRLFLARFGESAPDIPDEDVRAYVEELADMGRSPSYASQARSALRFFYTRLAGRADPLDGVRTTRDAGRADRAFTREEISRLLDCTEQPLYRLAFMLMYSSGLRTNEVCALRRRNVDTEGMLIRVNDTAGRHLRTTMLPRSCLALLYECLAGRDDDQPYLFPGRGKTVCVTGRTLQRVFGHSLANAGLETQGRITLSWLRHSFAVHLLEDGTDRRLVQELMGIVSTSMMTPYVRLAAANRTLRVMSPLDRFYERG